MKPLFYLKNKVVAIITLSLFVITLWACGSSNVEEPLIGRWKLSGYGDNAKRTSGQQDSFNIQVDQLKKMVLVLNSDHSYSRTLEQQSEMGRWDVTDNGKIFSTSPTSGGQKMSMLVERIGKEELVFKIMEKEFVTVLTFSRQIQ